MTREIIIDEDTKVGYGFQSKQFFVDNKGTRTTRKGDTIEEGAKQAYNVLHIIAPDFQYKGHAITWEDLKDLAETDEEVTSLSCTLEDSGAYIKTITLNDYDYYPLTIDCDLNKLYIMNTDKVYDLTLNIDPQTYIDDLIFFYSDTLGLDNTQLTSLIPSLYSLLLSYYYPHITNLITKRKDTSTPLYYNNLIKLTNYNNTGTLTYTLTINPDNITNLDKLGDIIGVDQDTKTILISPSTPFSTFPETEDSHVYISGLSETIGAETYTADGEYTCMSTDTTNNTLVVKEALPFSYSFPYPKVYLQKSDTSISSISNTDSTIILSSATGFNIGDTITIHGSLNNVNDGEYTIIGKDETTLTLDSTPPVQMTSNCGNACILTYVGETETINGAKITLRDNPAITVSSGMLLKVGETWDKEVSSISGKEITLTNSTDLPTIPPYPTISYNKLAEIVNVNVTSSTLEELPVGEFNVDTYEQCQQYIGLGDESSYLPPLSMFTDANKQVPDNIYFEQTGYAIAVKGLYSEFYS